MCPIICHIHCGLVHKWIMLFTKRFKNVINTAARDAWYTRAIYRDVLWNVWPRMRPQARPLVKKQIMYLIRYKKKWCMSINVRILVMCLLWWVITHQTALKGPRAFIHWADGRLTARSREVSKPRDSGLDFSIALKVNRHIGSSAAEMPVKFQSDLNIIKPNLRLRYFSGPFY